MKTHFILIVLAILLTSCQDEKTIFVADEFGSCEEACLQIREHENDDWTNFLGEIEGFDYEQGYAYKLKVKIEKKNADVVYTLLEVLSKSKTKQTSKINLNNTEWAVTHIEGFENKTSKSPNFTINNENIRGNSGCNTFGGSFETDNKGMFKVGMLRMTKMYCEAYMDLENAFTGALSKATSYQIDEDTLQVLNNEGKAVFTATQKMKTKSILDKWYVTTIKGFNNSTEKIPHFTIASGKIKGNNGCNSFGGDVEIETTGNFKVGLLNVTEMYCEKTAALERAFHDALRSVTSFKITDDTLFLLDASKYVLISASTNSNSEHATTGSPFIIEYNTYSRDLAFRNKVLEEKNVLYYYDLRPEKTDEQKVILSKSELLFFKESITKLDLKEIEILKPPSTKHQHDGAAGATLIITFEGKTYRVPTFDHGNPPMEISSIIEKIMALRSK